MRLPVIPTILVSLSVSAMIALGVWQLQRAEWKDALLATYAANQAKPDMAFPQAGPVPDLAIFRRSQVTCLSVRSWKMSGSVDKNGRPGTRHIADCTTGATGQGALVDMGVASDPKTRPKWTGGIVSGVITTEPDFRSLIGKIFARNHVLRPMLVADQAAPGLVASPLPSPTNVANNHFAYAIQWFLFAASAAIIYLVALHKRKQR